MPTFDDLILSLTCRLVHETDFAFEKNNGELANLLRVALSSAFPPGSQLNPNKIAIDPDGDIAVETDGGSLFVTADSVIVTGWVTTPKSLSESQHLDEISQVLDLVFNARTPLKAESYQTRLFFSARFLPRHAASLPLNQCSSASLKSVLGENIPSGIKMFRMSATYDKEGFSDSLEFESSWRDVQLRYGRESVAGTFESYRKFLHDANMRAVVEDLRPFIDGFVADPSKLLGRVFKESPRSK